MKTTEILEGMLLLSEVLSHKAEAEAEVEGWNEQALQCEHWSHLLFTLSQDLNCMLIENELPEDIS